MSASVVLFYVFAVTSALYVLHIGVYMVGANVYDMWQCVRLGRRKKLPISATEPLVSVLIPAHNEELVIERCLRSVLRSKHPRLQVIVIDDYSTDATAAVVRQCIAHNPHANIHLLSTPANVGKGSALNYALRRKVRGEFVMTIDADSIISPATITNALTYFDDPNVAGVAANVRIIEEPTVLGVLQRFEHLISYRSKKFYTVVNCEFVVGGVASTYRTALVRKVGYYDTTSTTEDIGLSIKLVYLGNKQHKLVYGSDVAAMTEGVMSLRALMRQRYRWKYGSLQNIIRYRSMIFSHDTRYTKSLTYYRLPLAVLSEIVVLAGPISWVYVAYLTFVQHNPRLVVGAFITMTLYTLVALWFDEHTQKGEKLRLSIYSPLMYIIFYIMDIVQFVGIVRCLLNSEQMVSREQASSVWVSPVRAGREVNL